MIPVFAYAVLMYGLLGLASLCLLAYPIVCRNEIEAQENADRLQAQRERHIERRVR